MKIFLHKETGRSLHYKSQGNTLVAGIGKEKGGGEYINHVEETAGKREAANLFSYSYKTKDGQTARFRWLTDIELTERNLEEINFYFLFFAADIRKRHLKFLASCDIVRIEKRRHR